MGRKRSVCAALAVFLLGAMAAWADSPRNPTGAVQPDPTGEWLVAKELARIRIVDCAGRLWGVVSWELRPGIDKNNPDRNQRSQPTLGMPILLGMVRTKMNQWDGQIYNSEDGRTYSANISLVNPDTLRVQGCVLGILCGGENWSRYQPPPITPSAAQPPNARPTNARPSKSAVSPPDNPTESDGDVCLRLVGSPRLPH
jgi:uncharacterized protein (DUF2147 family)